MLHIMWSIFFAHDERHTSIIVVHDWIFFNFFIDEMRHTSCYVTAC